MIEAVRWIAFASYALAMANASLRANWLRSVVRICDVCRCGVWAFGDETVRVVGHDEHGRPEPLGLWHVRCFERARAAGLHMWPM